VSGVVFDNMTAGRQDPVLDGSEFFVREVTLTSHFFVQNQQLFRIGGILGCVFEKSCPNPKANQQKGREYAEEHGHCRKKCRTRDDIAEVSECQERSGHGETSR